jgi:site-specific recombinase XerC
MTKALLLLAWVPFLSVSTPQVIATTPVSVSCDTALELMDIVKNDDVVTQKIEDRLLLELRKDFIARCR